MKKAYECPECSLIVTEHLMDDVIVPGSDKDEFDGKSFNETFEDESFSTHKNYNLWDDDNNDEE